ncbi:MAG: hypothetical protein ACK4S4_15800 [Pyrinomonadaceae bacterium]
MGKTIVYAAENHPTALRLSRLRKKFGARFHSRNPSFWFPGTPEIPAKKTGERVVCEAIPARPPETEVCDMVVVDQADSPIVRAYLDRGFVLDLGKNRKDLAKRTGGKPTVRVLRPRKIDTPPSIIDPESDDRITESMKERMSRSKPISKEGQEKVAEVRSARAVRKGPNNKKQKNKD